MSTLRISEEHPLGHDQQQDLPCHSRLITITLWDHGSSRKEWMLSRHWVSRAALENTGSPISSSVSHTCFGCPFSQGTESSAAQLLANLWPQGKWSCQREKLNQPQLLCLLNSIVREGGDTSASQVFAEEVGKHPFFPGTLCSYWCNTWMCSALVAQHSQASFWRCCFLPRPPCSSSTAVLVWLKMGKVCPPGLGCKWGLSHSGAESQLSGFAPVVCQILSIHRKMMKNISVSLWLFSS